MGHLYDEYLHDHIANVQKAYDWMVSHKIIPPMDMITNIAEHDKSKRDDDEYNAYDRYFYGDRNYQVVRDFNYAWLRHIHKNPHHWQHWVLHNDEEPDRILEIPPKYVYEMIADWWSFSWKTGNLHEIFKWYDKHRNLMKLNPSTRVLINETLDKIKKELNLEEARACIDSERRDGE